MIFMQNCGYTIITVILTSLQVFKVSLKALLMSEFTRHFWRLNSELQFSKSGCMHKYFLEFPFLWGLVLGGNGIGFFSRLFKWLNFEVQDQDTGY